MKIILWNGNIFLSNFATFRQPYTCRSIEVKYNKISHLGILNGDRVRLIRARGDHLKEDRLIDCIQPTC